VRLRFVHFAVLAIVGSLVFASRAVAQRPDTMMPEESAAKGKLILGELINGLGGDGYSEVRESQCEGRRVVFGHNGDPMGNIAFADYRRFPDKDRVEYIAKGHNSALKFLIGVDGLDWSHGGVVITVYNGDRGWTYDKSGVNELPVTSISDFQEQVKRSVDNLLRLRLKEPGLMIRYGGSDTVDLKEVDWVEITDTDDRKFRLAVDKSTHRLVRSTVTTKDQENEMINTDVSIYSNYQLKDSVWTPLQISREHNGRRASQYFYDSCRYNPGFADNIFDKSSLSKQAAQALEKKNRN
jgi:hypothetical protein